MTVALVLTLTGVAHGAVPPEALPLGETTLTVTGPGTYAATISGAWRSRIERSTRVG